MAANYLALLREKLKHAVEAAVPIAYPPEVPTELPRAWIDLGAETDIEADASGDPIQFRMQIIVMLFTGGTPGDQEATAAELYSVIDNLESAIVNGSWGGVETVTNGQQIGFDGARLPRKIPVVDIEAGTGLCYCEGWIQYTRV